MLHKKACLLLLSVLIVISFLFSYKAYAVPAAPIIHTLTQPDETTFRAKLWGDEFLHGWETEEGYSIVFDEDLKCWTYAALDINGRLVSSFKKVGIDQLPADISKHLLPERDNQSQTPQRALSSNLAEELPQDIVPPQGTGNIPVILVNFKDRTTTFTTADFNTLLFGTGNYSMKDYYNEVSYGAFTVSAGPSGVAGWYTAANTHDYYGQNGGIYNIDRWPGTLVREAVAAADAAGFNFAPYDADGDGYVDVVAIIHQGTGEEAGGPATDIWSHSWDLNSAYYYGYSNGGEYVTNDPKPGGGFIKVNNYVIQPEILSGSIQTMGVFAHEYGHALGLPDLYDTDYSSQGIGNWSLMAGGVWDYVTRSGDRPAHLDAWCKYKLGWITPTIVSGALTNEPISQAATNADIYQLLNGSPSTGGEYFLVENRQKVSFDAGLPGPGLLIWHIDENMSSNNNECYPGGPSCTANHYHVALEQADNLWELEKNLNRGNQGDQYPGSTGNTSFTGISSPNSNLWNGNPSGISITNISLPGSTMTATLSAHGDCSNYDKIRMLVREYYLDILGREPDQAGWDGWTNEICRISTILGIYVGEGFQAEAKFFFNSPEYLALGKNDNDFVTDLYKTFLQRTPSQTEIDSWVTQLNAGLTRNMLITSFAYSPEFTTDMINTFGPDTTRPENNLLNDLYRGFLSRFPDTSGYNSWLVQMRVAQCTGAQAVRDLCYQISLGFVQSAEYTARIRTDAEYVEDLYNAILRRGADPAGFQAWINNLNTMTRQQVLQAFTNSTEFQTRVNAVIAAGCLP